MKKSTALSLAVLFVASLDALFGQVFASQFSGCGFVPSFWSAGQTVGEIGSNIGVEHSEDRVCAYYFLGTLLQSRGDSVDALKAYQDSIAAWPPTADIYEMMGDTETALGDVQKAADLYHKAEALAPDRWRQLGWRCWVRATRGWPLDRLAEDGGQ